MCKAFVKSSYFLNVLLVFGLLQYTTAIKANSKADELKKLQQKLKEAISDTARITTLIDISWYYLYINTDSALTYAKNAYKLSKLPTNIINSASALGVTYSKKGDFENSVKYNLEAFHYAQKIHDKGNYSCLLNDIGSNYFMLDDLEKALKYFTSALEFSHDLETTYVALFNLGQIYAVKGNFTEAYSYFEKALKVAEKENKTKRIALIYNRIGELFLDKKNYPKSLYYFDRSLNMLGTDEFYYRISCLRGKSYSNLGTGRYAIALKTALQADTLARKGAFVNALSDIDLLISQIYDSLRNPSKSKVYFKRYAAIKDSMFNTEKNERITFLQTKFENKQHEMEAQQLKQQAGFHRKMSYVYLIIGISLLIVLFYIIKNIRQTNKILHFEKVILTQQQENERLEKQNLRLKLDEKHREILTHAFQIQQQKEVLTLIQSEIGQIIELKVQTILSSLEKLNTQIKTKLNLSDDWDQIKIHFEKVHPDFFTRIKEDYPDLTVNDLKLCAYSKLKFSNKEIGRLLNINASSVQVSRYRLKKKMNISEETNFDDFIHDLHC